MWLSELWNWRGETGRAAYAVIGCLLSAFKYNLDRLVALKVFGHAWSPLYYYRPGKNILELSGSQQLFWTTMVAVSLPFLYVGLLLTVRRLRSIGLTPWLVFLFFVPVVNVFFFVTLCILPAGLSASEDDERENEEAEAGEAIDDEDLESGMLGLIIPENPLGSAAMSLAIPVPIGVIFLLFGVRWLTTYGWGLFIALPFWLGAASVLIYGYHERRSFFMSMLVASLTIGLFGASIFVLAIEGAICLIMAAPIGVVLGGIGGVFGYFLQDVVYDHSHATETTLVALMALVPLLMGAESAADATPPMTKVSTSVVVDAPREVVWDHVVDFSELPPPSDPIFQTGIAYPTDARMVGHGTDAVRHCHFTTGTFVEPIEVWDAPERLAFSVRKQPQSLEELTPFEDIDAPHVDGFLLSKKGEFRLEALAGGRTRLTGTTWYRHRIWPVAYWRMYSDFILHRIHRRVLRHVRRQAEQKQAG